MNEKEYFTTKEIAISTSQTTRNIRYKANKLDVPSSMMFKDEFGTYYIHHLLLPHFAPKNTGKSKSYAMTFDILSTRSESDIIEVMEYITDEFERVKMKYSIETKNNGMKHIHAIVEGVSKSDFRNKIREFYHEHTRVYVVGIYDKQGWIKYIGKEAQIITIDKTN